MSSFQFTDRVTKSQSQMAEERSVGASAAQIPVRVPCTTLGRLRERAYCAHNDVHGGAPDADNLLTSKWQRDLEPD